jgi:hypothetical protein
MDQDNLDRRPYSRPEIKRIGSVQEMTQLNMPGSADSDYNYAGSDIGSMGS